MPDRTIRVLLLGGTEEAAALARALDADPRLHLITSLAGRTKVPATLPGELRSGGFGGADGLAVYLRQEGIDAVLDATHPFAATMSRHAAEACGEAQVPCLHVVRVPWTPVEGDDWIPVPTAGDAAAQLHPGQTVLLTVGRQELAPFAARPDVAYVVRLIDPPSEPLPFRPHALILARGPFALEAERSLLARYRIDVLVCKNSGGSATYAKVAAAREKGIPVVMIERPSPPGGTTVATVDAALDWLAGVIGAERAGGLSRRP